MPESSQNHGLAEFVERIPDEARCQQQRNDADAYDHQ